MSLLEIQPATTIPPGRTISLLVHQPATAIPPAGEIFSWGIGPARIMSPVMRIFLSVATVQALITWTVGVTYLWETTPATAIPTGTKIRSSAMRRARLILLERGTPISGSGQATTRMQGPLIPYWATRQDIVYTVPAIALWVIGPDTTFGTEKAMSLWAVRRVTIWLQGTAI